MQHVAKIDLDHPSLEGHFPGQPIVPGVVILDEIIKAFNREQDATCKIQKIPFVKFLLPLQPGAQIVFTFDMSDSLVRFTGKCCEKIIVVGQLEYSITP